ncbi:MAG: hypothetical protein GJU76_11820 [Gallionella sp.]|jgi:hypothetical protein|nr:hypothetical protein [Gallionella sp.]
MPAKTNRKQPRNEAARKPAKPRRAPNGRFKGQPRTISETVMPEELTGPATEAPRDREPEAPPACDPTPITDFAAARADLMDAREFVHAATRKAPPATPPATPSFTPPVRKSWLRRAWEWWA